MKRFGFFITALVLLLSTACEKEYVPTDSIRAEVSNNTYSSVAIKIIHVGYTRVTNFGVYLSTNPKPTTSDKRCDARTNGNTYYEGNNTYYKIELTELKPNTTYYILPYVENEWGPLYGEVVEFTTQGTAKVTTQDATDVTTNYALLHAVITKEGSVNIQEKGFVYAKHSSPTINDYYVYNSGTSAGSYSITTNRLSENSKYYFRGYIKVDDTYIYGNVKSFTTLSESAAWGSSIDDFVGSYSMYAYNRKEDSYQTINGISIYTFENNNTNSTWIAVRGLAGYSDQAAIGQYDATFHAVKLYSGWYFNIDTYTMSSYYGDTLFRDIFYPVEYTSSGSYLMTDGKGYSGAAEAWLTFDDYGNLVLGPASTSDNNGRYANGFVFGCHYAMPNKTDLCFWRQTFTNVQLTKQSSYAPAVPASTVRIEQSPVPIPKLVSESHASMR